MKQLFRNRCVSSLRDWPPAVLSPRWSDSRHDRLHLHTPLWALLCWGKIVGLQSGFPNIESSCRQHSDTVYLLIIWKLTVFPNFTLLPHWVKAIKAFWHVIAGKAQVESITLIRSGFLWAVPASWYCACSLNNF